MKKVVFMINCHDGKPQDEMHDHSSEKWVGFYLPPSQINRRQSLDRMQSHVITIWDHPSG